MTAMLGMTTKGTEMTFDFEPQTAPEAFLQDEMRKLLSPDRWRAVLDWRMCSDPWPGGNMDAVDNLLNDVAAMMGFDGWVAAYHMLPPNASVTGA